MKRLQVELHGDSLASLAQLKAAMDAASDAEVLRRSVQLVNQIVEHLDGGKLIVERKNGERVEIVLAGVHA